MAEIWVAGAAAVVGAGAAIYASNKQAGAAKDAANASNAATQASIDEQKREFDINQANQAPWLNTGQAALSQLAGLYGLNGGSSGGSGNTITMFDGTTATPLGGSGGSSGAAAQPDYSAFFNSPDYQFALQGGQQAQDRTAAANGTLFSGAHTADAIAFGQGLASQQFGNYYNRLAGLAGVGQTAANQLGAYGQNYANSIGQLNANNAANQTQSIYNRANANSNMVNSLAGIGGQLAGYYMNRPQTYNTNNTFGTNTANYSQFTNPDVSSFYGNGGGLG
jgi:hypothetical protein